MTLAAIPSPSQWVWHLGPVPIRAYALLIVLGIVIACVVTEYRLRERGAPRYAVLDLAVWAVPFGVVGARIYHVITSPEGYFGPGGEPLKVFQIWHGGLGIWGAISGGALGVWFACRQLKLPMRVVADAAAVGIPLAQAVGRLGNWFNNELYGSRTTLPWGLEVHQLAPGGDEPLRLEGEPVLLPGLYHPTFLYELLWNVGVAALVWQVGKRLRLGAGRQFALYVAGYTAGRFWIEMLRIDDANTILGARVNVWVAALVFLGAVIYLLRVRGEPEYLLPAGEGGGYRVVTAAEYRQATAAADAGADAATTEAAPPAEGEAAQTPADGGPAEAPTVTADAGGAPAEGAAERSSTAGETGRMSTEAAPTSTAGEAEQASAADGAEQASTGGAEAADGTSSSDADSRAAAGRDEA
ncbi:MAG: prolipoprotein diacylglyceryl transferase [Micromonosporaceae bacterium]